MQRDEDPHRIQTVFFLIYCSAYSAFPCTGPKNYTPAT